MSQLKQINKMANIEPTPEEIQATKLYKEWGLSESEYQLITDSILDRLPNYTETGLFSVMWSEHCSYKNSKPVLKKFPTTGKHVLQGPGEGAGIIDIGDDLAVVFKAESHNHPSAIEPYEGAATGVGGIIRDIFSMGARPIALLDSLRFGELDNATTKYLLEEVVSGIGGYGNCIGIPTVGGEIGFDPCYQGNPLVNAMCVGVIEHKDIQKGQAKGKNNPIMYVGAKAGRDGIHGATFASEEFTSEKEQQRSAVQVGDPFMEKLLLEACLEVITQHADILIGIQDMGAAGLVSSSSEMASKAGSGLVLNLDDVPQREQNMSPYEMMLSESQERMLLCVKAGSEKIIADLFKRYDLEAVSIGYVTDNNQYQLWHKDRLVANVPVDALAEAAPVYQKPYSKPKRCEVFAQMKPYQPKISSAGDILKQLLAQPTIASKRSIYETYDSQVLTNTVVKPGSDAAVVRIKGTNKALAMTTDCNSRYLYLNPEIGGSIAVSEAARNIVASGGKPLGITDCLNYGSPDQPEGFYELWASADGIADACEMLETPVISGNVSLYNETNGKSIYPTPVIGMVGLIEDLAHITTQEFKQVNDLIYIIGETKADFSGTELQKMLIGRIEGPLMAFDLPAEKNNQNGVLSAIRKGFVQSAHDVSEGGIAVALSESAFPNEFGMNVTLSMPDEWLFSETQSRFVLSIKPNHQQDFETLLQQQKVPFNYIGKVTADGIISIKTDGLGLELATNETAKIWEEAIACLLK